MKEVSLIGDCLSREQVSAEIDRWLKSLVTPPKKVLLLPPDFTRFHSQAGLIVGLLYQILSPRVQVDIMPALGTHVPMSREQKEVMFGREIPQECYLEHDWRHGVEKIGEIPADFVSQVSGGLLSYPMAVEVNKK